MPNAAKHVYLKLYSAQLETVQYCRAECVSIGLPSHNCPSYVMPKRKRQNHQSDEASENPNRQRLGPGNSELAIYDVPSSAANTPTKPRRGRPPGSVNKPKAAANGDLLTPLKEKGKVLISATSNHADNPITSSHNRNIGQKAKPHDFIDDNGEVEDLDERTVEESLLVRNIREERDGESQHSEDIALSEGGGNSPREGPSTKSPGKRRKQKSPTPPPNLPPHEHYFWQNRPGRQKTSNNTFSSALLTHERYHELMSAYDDPNAEAYEILHEMHSRSFPQWAFEFSQNFNICLHGYGSKRRLVTDFAEYLHDHLKTAPEIFIINGYTPNVSLKIILTNLASLVYKCNPGDLPSDLGSQPNDMLGGMLVELNTNPPTNAIYVFINSLDAPPMRRSPTPSLLAQLASHPSINMLATCDQPNFPLLWDVKLREQYNWLFHDTTTFISYGGVEIASVVDEVNELLGRSGRSVKGKGGASYVLKSLTESARNLYRLLIAEILGAEDEAHSGCEDGDDGKGGGDLGGVDRKSLYQKAAEEFVCSSEMGFGQLLKEFYDHEMLIDKRAGDGTMVLSVPWRREECEELLEQLLG